MAETLQTSPHLGILHGRPSTFLERGVCVPFTTPLLSQARLRMDRYGQLECLLPGFSGGKGTYVFSWKTVPEVFRTTLHDRALHREIQERKANTPDAMRSAALSVAARGLAGIAAAVVATEALEKEQRYAVVTNYVLVLELLREAGVNAPDLIRAMADAEQARQMAKNALKWIADSYGMTADEMYALAEEISAQLAPVGFPHSPTPGRLRDLVRRLGEFRDQMNQWAGTDATDAAGLATFLAKVADETLGIAQARLTSLDWLLVKTRALMVEPAVRAEARSLMGTLSWLMDGWDYMVQIWQDAADQSDDVQRQTLCELFRIAPVIPMEELASNENLDVEALRAVQRRWVRGNQDWRTGGLDYDAVRRIEAAKANIA